MTDKNYITPEGLKALQEELKALRHGERPEVTATVAWAASNGDRSENADYQYGKRRLREIDRRIHFLVKQIEAAEVIDPQKVSATTIQFGATVRYSEEDGTEKVVTIVGMDESDMSQGKISWKAPLASALMRKKSGDIVAVNTPGGEREIEVLEFHYGSTQK